MLIIFYISCQIGRPTLNTSITNIEWKEEMVVSPQWKLQLEQSLQKSFALEAVRSTDETHTIDVIQVSEALVSDDKQVGQIWSITITVMLENEHIITEEDRYLISRSNMIVSEQNRIQSYQRLLDRLSHQVILFYKYETDNEH